MLAYNRPSMNERSTTETWRRMVLRSLPLPAWLSPEAPDGDLVVSSRCRHARNLAGRRFPHHAEPEELGEVSAQVSAALEACGEPFHRYSSLSETEREYLLGCRLVSPDFPHRERHRWVAVDDSRTTSLMVNEEDHLRLQSLTPGWSLEGCESEAARWLDNLSSRLEFARAEPWGWLTASPSNAGNGRRRSALFHLIGLAHSRRLGGVLDALGQSGCTARGLFGETSRAVGAFFQVSMTGGERHEFKGACEYLIREERTARSEVGRKRLHEQALEAAAFAVASQSVGVADALRVLAWLRWASASELPGFAYSYRDVDTWVSTMEVHGTQDPEVAARHRAAFLRERVEGRAT